MVGEGGLGFSPLFLRASLLVFFLPALQFLVGYREKLSDYGIKLLELWIFGRHLETPSLNFGLRL
jgi:hypothetical protein